jgi:hypothetical protein
LTFISDKTTTQRDSGALAGRIFRGWKNTLNQFAGGQSNDRPSLSMTAN